MKRMLTTKRLPVKKILARFIIQFIRGILRNFEKVTGGAPATFIT